MNTLHHDSHHNDIWLSEITRKQCDAQQQTTMNSHFNVEEFGVLWRLVESGEMQQCIGTAVAIKHSHCKRRGSRKDLTQAIETPWYKQNLTLI